MRARAASERPLALLAAVALLASVALAACLLPRGATAAVTPGARIAYVTGTARTPSRVVLASASGSEAKVLGLGSDPLLAPSGQLVAASLFGSVSGEDERGPAIALYSALGNAPVSYLNLETATAQPLAWSPDSRYLALQAQSTAVPEKPADSGLFVVDTQTGAIVQVAEGTIYGASFARDGSDRVVYGLAHGQAFPSPSNLYVANPDGSGVRRLTSDGRSLNPVWGPRDIAFDRERLRRNDAPVFQIWLGSPNGGPARRLTNLKVPTLLSGLAPVAFSADGSRLLAEYGGQDTSEAWALRVPSGRARRVTVRGQPVVGAAISADGSSLLVNENEFENPPSSGRVALVPFAGGRAKVIVAHGSQASWNG